MAKVTPVRRRIAVTEYVDVRYTLAEYRLVKQILGATSSDTVLNPAKFPSCISVWRSMEPL